MKKIGFVPEVSTTEDMYDDLPSGGSPGGVWDNDLEQYNQQDFFSKGSSKSKGGKGGFKRCWETHPPLPIVVEGKTYFVRGGSCHYEPKETDIFLGFDYGMSRSSSLAYPWVKGEAFLYEIMDMHAPSDPKSFKQLIGYLAKSILAGKRVYMGCIGGHGRTGLVLAALVTYMTGELDSIAYVRKHYCKKAVEAKCQVTFLNKHFGITKAEPTKTYGDFGDAWGTNSKKKRNAAYDSRKKASEPKDKTSYIRPVKTHMCIHGKKAHLK